MENIVWEKVEKDENGIFSIAFENLGEFFPNVGTIVGYNGILKGDKVMYEGKEYTVVMVSRLGNFGLSDTGKLPYSVRVIPSKVTKVQGI